MNSNNASYVKKHIKSLKQNKIKTLDHKKPFTVDEVKGNLLFITTSTGTPRNVPLQGTIDAYNHIMKHGTLTRTEIRENNYSDWNPAYIAAILANFPEIEYTTRPIILHKKPSI